MSSALSNTFTSPNASLLGATVAAGVTHRVLALEIPLALAVIVSAVLLSADVVMMSNGCDCSPADTTMLVATGVAIAGLLLQGPVMSEPAPKPALAPKPAPKRELGPLPSSKTALVPFEISPFPYRGQIPEKNRPFIDVTECGVEEIASRILDKMGLTRHGRM